MSAKVGFLILAAILILQGCADHAGPRISDRRPPSQPDISAEQARQEAFCAAFDEVLAAQPGSFMTLRGRSIDQEVWLASVRLPGMRLCTVSAHIKPVYQCRASEGDWNAQDMLRGEFRYFSRLIGNCLNGNETARDWYESSTTDSPPGLAKFYKNGKTQIYLSTSQDVRSRLYYTSLRIED